MATGLSPAITSVCIRKTLEEFHILYETKKVEIPECQRLTNFEWVLSMVQSYLRDYVNNRFIMIPGLFQLCQDNTPREGEVVPGVDHSRLQILDGQHRYEAYKYCLKLASDPINGPLWFKQLLNDETNLTFDMYNFMDTLRKLPIDIKIYTITDKAHAKFLFDRINNQLVVQPITTSTDEIIRSTINRLRNDFRNSSVDHSKSRDNRSKINYELLEGKLRASKIVEAYDIKTAAQLHALVMQVNIVFMSSPLETKACFANFPNASRTTTYLDKKRVCYTAGLMLGLYPNYEWVDELVGQASFYLMSRFTNNYTDLKKYFASYIPK